MVQQVEMNVKQYQLVEQLVDHVQLILIHISIEKKNKKRILYINKHVYMIELGESEININSKILFRFLFVKN